MTVSVSPREDDVWMVLRTFLIGGNGFPGALADGADAVLGQVNRVPAVKVPNYAVYWPLRRRRLGTNQNALADAKFTGSIAGNVMTITAVQRGAIKTGSWLFGVGLPVGLSVKAFGSGTGGPGTYTLSESLGTPFGPETISAGVQNIEQQTELTVQIDVHGPRSAGNAQRVSTLLRDEWGVRVFAAACAAGGFDGIVPLHADEPKQIPFVDDQNQVEDRWIVEACIQLCDVVLDVPQQFADSAVVGLKDVDAFYPP